MNDNHFDLFPRTTEEGQEGTGVTTDGADGFILFQLPGSHGSEPNAKCPRALRNRMQLPSLWPAILLGQLSMSFQKN